MTTDVDADLATDMDVDMESNTAKEKTKRMRKAPHWTWDYYVG